MSELGARKYRPFATPSDGPDERPDRTHGTRLAGL